MSRRIDKEALVAAIKQSHELSDEQKADIFELISTKKKYGLVWEESNEDVFEELKTKLPILREVENRRIVNDTALEKYPNHVLIEGENLQALVALTYTHAGMIDVIYVDPPYNSGARDWYYNNDYVDREDDYRHSKWISMIYHRLTIAKELLNPLCSVLIVTIDEKEYHHLGCLLEELFPNGRIQMISTVINVKGVARESEFSRVNEYIYIVQLGASKVEALPLSPEWLGNVKTSGRNKVRLGSLLRSGSNSERSHSPGCFYPIYFTKEGKYIKAGEPIDIGVNRDSVQSPWGNNCSMAYSF